MVKFLITILNFYNLIKPHTTICDARY